VIPLVLPTSSSTPSPSPSGSVLPEDLLSGASAACADGATLCRWVSDATGSRVAGEWAELLVGTPLRIVLILVIGFLARLLLHKLIRKVEDRIAADRPVSATDGDRPRSRYEAVLAHSPLASERRVQRARTMGTVLRSVATGVVATIIVLMILGELGLNIGPLLASAGILGVALGFGAQSLVKDFLSGLFMIVEDQYGVGDVVDLGEASGAIEAVGLRVTRLRSVDGTVWYVPNGQIQRVGNQSQGWARAVLDIGVAYGEDIPRVQALLTQVGQALHADPAYAALIMEEPEVWGVEALSADSVVVRIVVKTVPLEQWTVARELRRRIKAAFDAEGIEIPFPQRTVWMRDERERTPREPADD
jgi:small-conductance mechanosensitive channel